MELKTLHVFKVESSPYTQYVCRVGFRRRAKMSGTMVPRQDNTAIRWRSGISTYAATEYAVPTFKLSQGLYEHPDM